MKSMRIGRGGGKSEFAVMRFAVSTGLFLDGLLGDERRKTSWMRAEAAGGETEKQAVQ